MNDKTPIVPINLYNGLVVLRERTLKALWNELQQTKDNEHIKILCKYAKIPFIQNNEISRKDKILNFLQDLIKNPNKYKSIILDENKKETPVKINVVPKVTKIYDDSTVWSKLNDEERNYLLTAKKYKLNISSEQLNLIRIKNLKKVKSGSKIRIINHKLLNGLFAEVLIRNDNKHKVKVKVENFSNEWSLKFDQFLIWNDEENKKLFNNSIIKNNSLLKVKIVLIGQKNFHDIELEKVAEEIGLNPKLIETKYSHDYDNIKIKKSLDNFDYFIVSAMPHKLTGIQSPNLTTQLLNDYGDKKVFKSATSGKLISLGLNRFKEILKQIKQQVVK